MNESLSAFVASAVEFIIGGLWLLVAGAFTVSAITDVGLSLDDVRTATQIDSSFGLAILIVALAYPIGIAGESLSRAIMEWDLIRVTVETEGFAKAGDEIPEPIEDDAAMPSTGRVRRAYRKLRYVLWSSWWHRMVDPRVVPVAVKRRLRERERQRAHVMKKNIKLNAEVESQLKRLRVERIAFLAVCIATIGCVLHGEWQAAGCAVIGAYVLGLLVHSRFTRYCGAIARGFEILTEEPGLVIPPPTVALEAAE